MVNGDNVNGILNNHFYYSLGRLKPKNKSFLENWSFIP